MTYLQYRKTYTYAPLPYANFIIWIDRKETAEELVLTCNKENSNYVNVRIFLLLESKLKLKKQNSCTC